MKYTSKKIQEILKSPSAVEGLDYIQPIYAEAETALWIMNACGLSLDKVKLWTTELSKQTVPQYATWTLEYWEELLGIPTDTSKTIEERQGLVMATRVARAPMNPRKVEKILKSISGCDVVITENTAKNTFSVEFTGEYTTKGKNRAKKKLDEVKPAHIIYFMTMFVHSSFETKNQLLFPNLKMSFSYIHFVDGICLDGLSVLDGSWLLTAKKKGILFPEMKIQAAGKKHYNTISEGLVSYWFGGNYQKNAIKADLSFSVLHTNFETGYRLDGRGILDGSWLLCGARKGIECSKLTTAMGIKNKNMQSADVKILCGIHEMGSSVFLRSFYLAQWSYSQKRLYQNTMLLETGIQNKNKTKATLTMDTMWRLEGSNSLEGKHKLNADITSMVI